LKLFRFQRLFSGLLSALSVSAVIFSFLLTFSVKANTAARNEPSAEDNTTPDTPYPS
jgi:hypothetical protein